MSVDATVHVSVVLRRIGLGRRSALEPFEPPNRYERRHPGELVHIDIKKLRMIGRAGKRALGQSAGRKTRGAGWEFVHVAVDDATRLAYVEVLENEKASTSIGFLRRAVRFFDAYGVTIRRVMTDNGSAYRSTAHALACRRLGIRHLRTRPYRPGTNGKAERFTRTMLDGWAYGAIYKDSWQRRDALAGWLDFYNHRRPHGSLGRLPPAERLAQLVNNVAGSYMNVGLSHVVLAGEDGEAAAERNLAVEVSEPRHLAGRRCLAQPCQRSRHRAERRSKPRACRSAGPVWDTKRPRKTTKRRESITSDEGGTSRSVAVSWRRPRSEHPVGSDF